MKQNLFKEIIDRFYFKKQYKFYLLFPLSLIAGFFEFFGVVLIFQFVLFISSPNAKNYEKVIFFFKENFDVQDVSKIILIIGLMIASIYIFKNLYMLIFVRFNNSILQDLSFKITTKIINNILYQDYLTVNKTTVDEKSNIISKIDLIVWQYCAKYINLIINLLIASILILFLFVKFTLIAISVTIFISILAFIEYKILKKNSKYQNEKFPICFNKMNSLFYKIFCAIKEIKLNNRQQFFANKVQENCLEYSVLYKNKVFFEVFHVYFTEIAVMLGFIVILFVLYLTTNFNNQLLIATICTICVIILRLAPVINRIQGALYAINSSKDTVKEVLNFNDMFDKDFKYINETEKLPFNDEIELRNIDFSYNNKTGLKNINLKIKKGEFIGIVGKSGCYKTTLSLILSGLIKPKNGEILVDNQKLDDSNYQKWQNNIALLSQDYSFLFDDINEFDKKYFEDLELTQDEKIKNLSFGQKQRLALANVLTQDKKVFILDEITSSSDVFNEDKINEILSQLKGQKTMIVIAHRLQILKHCNRIIYMDSGKIIDIDTFKGLNEKYEDFRKMIKLSSFKID